MIPLYIFLDLEAAHGDIFFGDIIEIAAQVDTRLLRDEVFHRLINTKQSLAYFALTVSKIRKEMLKDKQCFPDVFLNFMQWVSNVTKKCSKKFDKSYYPVLVAHGGFNNDFMMIQSNLERNDMDVGMLSKHNVHFSDTYVLAQKLRSRGVDCLKGCQLSIEKLYTRLFPKKKLVGQHRALPDVRFMMEIFLESPLQEYFDKIDIVSFDNRKKDYNSKNTSKEECKVLNDNLPEGMAKVTHTMTLKRLLRNGLTYTRLQDLFKSSISYLDFYDKLNDVGVDRKAAKAIASRLSSMGLQCEGGLTEIKNSEEVQVSNELNEKSHHKMARTDSGYESFDGCDMQDMFSNMFSDDFFCPPERYEYTFGSFTLKEIEDMDNYIDSLFFERNSRDKQNTDDTGNPRSENKSEILDKKGTAEFKMMDETPKKSGNSVVTDISENWDDEVQEDFTEYLIPANRGVLAKVVPIGMTMDDLNGESFSAKVPLFKHFEEGNLDLRPQGGIPKPKGKHARKNRRRTIRENKNAVRENCDVNDDERVVQAKTGEMFVLI